MRTLNLPGHLLSTTTKLRNMGHYLIVSAYPPDFTESAQLKYPPLVGVYLTLDTVSAAFRLAGKVST